MKIRTRYYDPLEDAEGNLSDALEILNELKVGVEKSRLSLQEIDFFKEIIQRLNDKLSSVDSDISSGQSEFEDKKEEVSNLEEKLSQETREVRELKDKFHGNLHDSMKMEILQEVWKKYPLEKIQQWFPEFAGIAFQEKYKN